MHISATFDAGNIERLEHPDPTVARLAIRPDVGGEHLQWFYFRVVGAKGVPCRLRIENAGRASYARGWQGYRACVSVDRQAWHRVETTYVDGVLEMAFTPSSDTVYVAYFAPYSHERHLDLIARCAAAAPCAHRVLGSTLEGRDLDLLQIGEPGADRAVLWAIARQHPGETMAEFWMEGFLGRLLDPACGLARWVRERAVVYVVPNMNPDGAVRGHLRTNAAGVNLNRVWHDPTLARSPEVKLVRDRMDTTGVHLCLDVHGDEALPYNFLAGSHGVPRFDARMADLEERFGRAYERANPAMQRVHGYPLDAPGQADLSMCSNQIAERFGALSLTLEMPFKDDANDPDPDVGWSPERCARLGASAVDAIAAVLDDLHPSPSPGASPA